MGACTTTNTLLEVSQQELRPISGKLLVHVQPPLLRSCHQDIYSLSISNTLVQHLIV